MPGDLSKQIKGFSGLSFLTTDVKSGNENNSSSQGSLPETYAKYSESRQSSKVSNESKNKEAQRKVVEDQKSIKNIVLAYSTLYKNINQNSLVDIILLKFFMGALQ